jgi:hypothetical protein
VPGLVAMQVKQLQHSDRDGAEYDKQEQLQELVSTAGWEGTMHMHCHSMQPAAQTVHTCSYMP